MPVIEDNFYRSYSKGVTFYVRTDGVAVPSPITTVWLAAMTKIVGLQSVKGPKLGRTTVELAELDQAPPTSVAPSPVPTEGVLTPALTQEMFWWKTKAPGEKDYGPVSVTLNMTSEIFDILTKWYEKDRVFPWALQIPAKANGGNTICMFFGQGFVSELKATAKMGALVQVDLSVQPAFGVGYISTCIPLSALARVWQNFIGSAACPS